MSEKQLIKREPSHKPLEHQRTELPLNDLQISTKRLAEHTSTRKEQDRILSRLHQEQSQSNASYILFDTVRRIIREGR